MEFLPADCTLLGGDLVMTSGLGGYYPAGLVIGSVAEVQQDDSGATSHAILDPAVAQLADGKVQFLSAGITTLRATDPRSGLYDEIALYVTEGETPRVKKLWTNSYYSNPYGYFMNPFGGNYGYSSPYGYEEPAASSGSTELVVGGGYEFITVDVTLELPAESEASVNNG